MSVLRPAALLRARRLLVVGPRSMPRRLARVALGGALIGTGAALMITADLGVTPWDVLVTAASGHTGMSVGVAGAVLSLVLYALCAPFGRLPGWGNLVLLVVISAVVDTGLHLLSEPSLLAGQLAMFAVGVPVLCLGVGLVVAADVGVGPLEMVMLVATDRGARLTRARVVIEGTTLVVGWLLGGAIGVGTAVFAVVAGHLIALALRLQGAMPEAPDAVDPTAPSPV
ncbi:YczE/YyaS/YitT family protein [Actinomarinicola tropica]|uniref:YitT family protein n=1 Tax=Actinomarinicola tropica TaxID=2789776 RepID=A0A5Q2RIV0_9ACTN|nr:hypothetical protein [Actinomarinicola tropica]QGG93760.1 hypothetical protein GH723_00765 [Actinomarinicola tropica]